jgi:hypothetical protein
MKAAAMKVVCESRRYLLAAYEGGCYESRPYLLPQRPNKVLKRV